MSGELCEDENFRSAPEERFVSAMLQILAGLIMEITFRFKAIEKVHDKFGFVSGVKMYEMSLNDLRVKAGDLADTYSVDINNSEIIFK